MTVKQKIMMTMLAAGFTAACVVYFSGSQVPEQQKTHVKTALETAGETCDAIAEKSVANLTAVVAFQKLEIFGRKINVMRRCMKDHGFVENKSWVESLSATAKKNADQQHISKDEALENLKRIAMYQFRVADQQPLYWVQMK